VELFLKQLFVLAEEKNVSPRGKNILAEEKKRSEVDDVADASHIIMRCMILSKWPMDALVAMILDLQRFCRALRQQWLPLELRMDGTK